MRHLTVILLAFTFSTCLLGQESTASKRGTAQTLTALENKWVEALAKADTATLDSILADNFWDTDEHGHRSDKQGIFSVLKAGDLKIQSIKLSDMKVHVYGDAAVVIATAAQVGNFRGQKMTATIVFTDTFVKQDGLWRAVASQRSPAE
jgi:ketosteroid isomerase-like protein